MATPVYRQPNHESGSDRLITGFGKRSHPTDFMPMPQELLRGFGKSEQLALSASPQAQNKAQKRYESKVNGHADSLNLKDSIVVEALEFYRVAQTIHFHLSIRYDEIKQEVPDHPVLKDLSPLRRRAHKASGLAILAAIFSNPDYLDDCRSRLDKVARTALPLLESV